MAGARSVSAATNAAAIFFIAIRKQPTAPPRLFNIAGFFAAVRSRFALREFPVGRRRAPLVETPDAE